MGKINLIRINLPWHRTRDYFGGSAWHKTIAQAGGGTLITQGSHLLDVALWAVGEQPVSAMGYTAAPGFDVEVDTLTQGIVETSGATMVVDLMLFDIALNSFQGLLGSTHGRSYERHKKWAARESIAGTTRLLFGTGEFGTSFNLSAPCFALSTRYRLPQVLCAVANDTAAYTNRQRMGLKLSEAERWGLCFEDFKTGWSISAWKPISTRAQRH